MAALTFRLSSICPFYTLPLLLPKHVNIATSYYEHKGGNTYQMAAQLSGSGELYILEKEHSPCLLMLFSKSAKRSVAYGFGSLIDVRKLLGRLNCCLNTWTSLNKATQCHGLVHSLRKLDVRALRHNGWLNSPSSKCTWITVWHTT